MSILGHKSTQEQQKHQILLKKIEEIGQAPCTDYADEFFFDDGTDAASRAAQTIAKSICQQCPAKMECLDYAVTARIQHGMWGGLTRDERNTLIRAMKAQPKTTS